MSREGEMILSNTFMKHFYRKKRAAYQGIFSLNFLHSVSRKFRKCDTQGKVTRKTK
jgi:hypothetical protein